MITASEARIEIARQKNQLFEELQGICGLSVQQAVAHFRHYVKVDVPSKYDDVVVDVSDYIRSRGYEVKLYIDKGIDGSFFNIWIEW